MPLSAVYSFNMNEYGVAVVMRYFDANTSMELIVKASNTSLDVVFVN